ncbi:MAG: GNAT family N-acetyltransferase [Phycisphaerales bacterium]
MDSPVLYSGSIMTPKATPSQAHRIPFASRLSAAERLVSTSGRREAARRLVASADSHGIDLNLMWGVLDPDPADPQSVEPQRVRQVALAVLGAGRTAMLFLSTPTQPPDKAPDKALNKPPRTGRDDGLGSFEMQVEDINAAAKAALGGLRSLSPSRVTLAQTLLEPEHTWAHRVCIDAGMISVGTLVYLRKPVHICKGSGKRSPSSASPPSWPSGIEVRAIRSLAPNDPASDLPLLIAALEGSYLETLDCPELCGLRAMEDVVDSHLATGEFDPSRWHLIFKDGQPAGCCLLSYTPAARSVELVYLGIAPAARGLGLGRSVLAYAINQLSGIECSEVTCAVDDRNSPAMKIYESLGFERFDARLGFVAPITPDSSSSC